MFPHERSLVKKYSNKPFSLVGVNTDQDRQTAQNFAMKKDVIWRSFSDTEQEAAIKYEIQFIPAVYLIDHNGVIRSINPHDKLDDVVEELVAAAS